MPCDVHDQSLRGCTAIDPSMYDTVTAIAWPIAVELLRTSGLGGLYKCKVQAQRRPMHTYRFEPPRSSDQAEQIAGKKNICVESNGEAEGDAKPLIQ